jgi:hypothetical protein
MKLRFVVSHSFRKERAMDGAPRIFSGMSEKQTRVLRLASLAQDDSIYLRMTAFLWMTEFCLTVSG